MTQFISTKLFFALQETLRTGIDEDINLLKKGYDEFVTLLFSESVAFEDKIAYHHILVYTRVELTTLTEVSGKKCSNLSKEDYRAYRQAN